MATLAYSGIHFGCMRLYHTWNLRGAGRKASGRAWLLLVCMLPYLLLGIASEGLHTEGLANRAQIATQHLDLSLKTRATDLRQLRQTLARLGGSGESNCLSCQWNASSAGVVPTLSHHSHSVPAISDIETAEVVAIIFHSHRDVPSRGPPAIIL